MSHLSSEVTAKPEGRPVPFAERPAPREDRTVVASGGNAASDPEPTAEGTESVLNRRLFPHLYEKDGRSPQESPAGVELAQFRIVEPLGAGGMAVVFRAEDRSLGRQVALKVLLPSFARDERAVQRFHNEARSGAQLDHENVVEVYHYGIDRGLPFIAYELVEGWNLRDLINREKRLSAQDAVNVGLQICAALRHLAMRQIVHRDIKPSNILITNRGQVKLIDLGLARDKSLDLSTDLTIAGTTLGTFDYISPEQAKDPTQVTLRSDIYSLGCTMYHMVTGEAPYPEGTVLQKLLDHQAKPPPDARSKTRHVSPRLSACLRRMMANDPKKRFATPEELSAELSEIAIELGLKGVPVDSVVWTDPKSAPLGFWKANFGWFAILFVLLGLVGFLNRFGDSVQKRVFPTTTVRTDDTTVLPSEDVESPTPNSQTTTQTPVPDPPTEELIGNILDPPGGDPLSEPLLPPPLQPTEIVDSGAGSKPKPDPFPSELRSPFATEPFRLVSADGTMQGEYKTLEAACSDASDGDRIELHFNGPRFDEQGQIITERPLTIEDKSVLIAGAFGYRPAIHFAPRAVPGSQAETRFVRIRQGGLQLRNIDLLVDLKTNQLGDDWVVFDLRNVDEVRFDRVTCTIDNPDFRPVRMFAMSPGRSGTREMTGDSGSAAGSTEILVERSFIRGIGDLLSLDEQRSLDLAFQRSVVALDGALLSVQGEMDSNVEEAQVKLRLTAVTALLSQGVVRIRTGESPPRRVPTVAVEADQSIFCSLNPSAPLVLIQGGLSEESLRDKLISWDGKNNDYERYREFLVVASSFAVERDVMTREDWKRAYEPDALLDEAIWTDDWFSASPTVLTTDSLRREVPESDGTRSEAILTGADLNSLPDPEGMSVP